MTSATEVARLTRTPWKMKGKPFLGSRPQWHSESTTDLWARIHRSPL